MLRVNKEIEIVQWFSRILNDPSLDRFDDLKTGAHLVQLVHSMNPNAFELSRCDFLASRHYHFEKNFKLLQSVMPPSFMPQRFVIELLMEGQKQRELFTFCSYVKQHYEAWMNQLVTRGGIIPTKRVWVGDNGESVLLPEKHHQRRPCSKLPDVAANVEGSAPVVAGEGSTAAVAEEAEGSTADVAAEGSAPVVAVEGSAPPVAVEGSAPPVAGAGSAPVVAAEGSAPVAAGAGSTAAVTGARSDACTAVRTAQETYNPALERQKAKEKRKARSRPPLPHSQSRQSTMLESISMRSGSDATSIGVHSAFSHSHSLSGGAHFRTTVVNKQLLSNVPTLDPIPIENWQRQVQTPTRDGCASSRTSSPILPSPEHVVRPILNGEGEDCGGGEALSLALSQPTDVAFQAASNAVSSAQPPPPTEGGGATTSPVDNTNPTHGRRPQLTLQYFPGLKNLHIWELADDASLLMNHVIDMHLTEIEDTDGECVAATAFVSFEELAMKKDAAWDEFDTLLMEIRV